MTVFEPGRICMKLAGRDAGSLCAILEEEDEKVLIDGRTRRRYVNPDHLEPVDKVIDVDKDATSDDIEAHLPQ
jgi:large subunit ribosomal protein L14e